MTILANPHRHSGLPKADALASGEICTDAAAARALFAKCPAAASTTLHDAGDLAAELGIATLSLKDERGRMGLGSFKALGAVHAIAKQAVTKAGDGPEAEALRGETFVCATAGNHGLSVAAGAKLFGANAVVYIAETVPEVFADRLRGKGATVVREGAEYQDSLDAALKAAQDNGWSLLSDTSWHGYTDPPRDVMEGYLIMGAEVAEQLPEPPTHVFLQAGVGGMAAACAAAARVAWGDAPRIIVVEPDAAPALMGSVAAGESVIATGPVSNMGRLDCKEASHLTLKYLAREADDFMTVTDAQATAANERLATHGYRSTPSGIAGIAGLFECDHAALGLTPSSRVLCYISEEPEDA